MDKVKSSLDARREKDSRDRGGFTSYATFIGHVLGWGVKMVQLKSTESVDIIVHWCRNYDSGETRGM